MIGDGRQYMSWITLDDVIGAIHHAIVTETLQGPVNAVAPEAVTNHMFTRTLGKVLKRPTLLPMPATAARLAFGEMADALLLSSARVKPSKLQDTGYLFRHRTLESGLRHVLGRVVKAS
jgi:NAD dependent epimerase/dehydratase family enzyme